MTDNKKKANWLFHSCESYVINWKHLKSLGLSTRLHRNTVESFFNCLYWSSHVPNVPAVCPMSARWWVKRDTWIKHPTMVACVNWAEENGYIHTHFRDTKWDKATHITTTERFEELVGVTKTYRPAPKEYVIKRNHKVSKDGESYPLNIHQMKNKREGKLRMSATKELAGRSNQWVLQLEVENARSWINQDRQKEEHRRGQVARWMAKNQINEHLLKGPLVTSTPTTPTTTPTTPTTPTTSSSSSSTTIMEDEMGKFNEDKGDQRKHLCANDSSNTGVTHIHERGCNQTLLLSDYLSTYHAVFHPLEKRDNSKHVVIDNFAGGGRMYSMFTEIPKTLRKHLLCEVNGRLQPLVEIDIPACQLRLMYHMANIPFPSTGWDHFSAPKAMAKAFVVFAIGSTLKEGRNPYNSFVHTQLYEDLEEKPTKEDIEQLLLELDPIRHLLFKGSWFDLHAVESDFIFSFATRYEVITVHDAIFCPEDYAEDISIAFEDEWYQYTGQRLPKLWRRKP